LFTTEFFNRTFEESFSSLAFLQTATKSWRDGVVFLVEFGALKCHMYTVLQVSFKDLF